MPPGTLVLQPYSHSWERGSHQLQFPCPRQPGSSQGPQDRDCKEKKVQEGQSAHPLGHTPLVPQSPLPISSLTLATVPQPPLPTPVSELPSTHRPLFPGTVSYRRVSLSTALSRGMRAKSLCWGTCPAGTTPTISLCKAAWISGFFERWYRAHVSVLDVWEVKR